MRRSILALAILLLFGSVANAQIKRLQRGMLMRPSAIRTVDQLKGLVPKTPQTKVMSGELNGKFVSLIKPHLNIGVIHSSASQVMSGAYKTGNGIVLKPSAMTDPNSNSELTLFGAQFDSQLVSQVRANSDAPIPIMCPAGQHGNLGFLFGYFRNMPAGKHVYMLTMRMNVKLDRAQFLQIQCGSNVIEKDSIKNMGDDYMALVIFDTAGGDGSMQIMAKFAMPQDDAIALLDFSYVQLAQVD